MIRSFRDRETERVFRGQVSRKLPRSIQRASFRKLVQLDQAVSLEALRQTPGNHLERLEHDRAGQWSIRINDQWRICFIWDDGAHRVEITDYH